MNIPEFIKSKMQKQKSSWVTCYDFSSATILAKSDITGVLIGDSVMMTIYGHSNTLNATSEILAQHTEAVAKGLLGSNKLIITDLPFLSYRGSLDQTLFAVSQIMRAGAHGVKIEGARGNTETVRHLVESGVPVMGHLGLTPQSLHTLGGFKVQAKTQEAQDLLLQEAQLLVESGCFSLVLECVPNSIAKKVTELVSVPVIGIGAGPHTDGQILVWQDMLGVQTQYLPKFVRQFGSLNETILKALNSYHSEVLNGGFPSQKESYGN
jgi:3-methyl-2-oxobutanoate hydroxymethyltransferase